MKTPILFALPVLLLAQTGCFQAVVVQKPTKASDGSVTFQKVPGIPFYVKASKYKQTTTYRRSYLRVTMSITRIGEGGAKDVAGPSMIQNMAKSPETMKTIRDLATYVNSPNVTLTEATKRFAALTPIDTISQPWETQPVSNTVTVVQEVKEDPVYYLNAKVPWFGKGSVDTKLAADGTLSEANTTAESTVAANGLPDLIPLKSYLEARNGIKVSSDDTTKALAFAAKVGDTIPIKFELAAEEVGELATFEKMQDQDPRSGTVAPLCKDFATGQFTIRPLDAGAKEKGGDDKAWALSATLTPPKPDEK